MFTVEGCAHVFGDNINTDYIIAGKYKFKTLDMDELARHVFESIDPGFSCRVRCGDIVVAGANFGCGSSREQAPLALQAAGIRAVIARSFARIFFRNAINNGLPVLECDVAGIETGDRVAVDIDRGTFTVAQRGLSLPITPLPPVMLRILADGGLIAHLRQHGTFLIGDGVR